MSLLDQITRNGYIAIPDFMSIKQCNEIKLEGLRNKTVRYKPFWMAMPSIFNELMLGWETGDRMPTADFVEGETVQPAQLTQPYMYRPWTPYTELLSIRLVLLLTQVNTKSITLVPNTTKDKYETSRLQANQYDDLLYDPNAVSFTGMKGTLLVLHGRTLHSLGTEDYVTEEPRQLMVADFVHPKIEKSVRLYQKVIADQQADS